MTQPRTLRPRHFIIRAAAAIGLCIALSGCIVVPVGHPFYHPYRYY